MIVDSQQYVNVFLGCLTILGFIVGANLFRKLPWDFWFCVFMAVGYISFYTYDWFHIEHYQVSQVFSWRQTGVRIMIVTGVWLKNSIFLYHIRWKK